MYIYIYIYIYIYVCVCVCIYICIYCLYIVLIRKKVSDQHTVESRKGLKEEAYLYVRTNET